MLSTCSVFSFRPATDSVKFWKCPRRRLLLGGGLGIAMFAVACWVMGGFLIAPVNHPVDDPPAEWNAETVRITSASGTEIAGWFVPADNATATVLLLHPLRGSRETMSERASELHRRGFAVLLIDLQGHGESSGEQLTFGWRESRDVTAAVDWIRERSPSHRIGIIGWSLGGAATVLAAPSKVDAIVLEAVYPTIEEAVHNRIAMRLGPLHHVLSPLLLMQLRPRLGIAPSALRLIDHIETLGCPVLFAVGEHDRRTTLDETKCFYEAASSPKRLVIFEDAGHVDLMEHDPQRYTDEVIGFLETHLLTE